MYIGLLFGCTAQNEQDDCPFKEVRKMDKKDLLDYWKNLSDKNKNDLINHHKTCLSKLTKKPF